MSTTPRGSEDMDERVQKIRNDELVGRGSCSVIDECYSNNELREMMDEEDVGVDGCVTWARRIQRRWLEQSLNYRCGEDDDPELLAWREWQEAEKKGRY